VDGGNRERGYGKWGLGERREGRGEESEKWKVGNGRNGERGTGSGVVVRGAAREPLRHAGG